MAGESPDKSERERSSGKTPEDPGSVPSARRRDPRESYAAPPPAEDDAGPSGDATASGEPEESESAGDARLRAAVAAWVSAAGGDGGEDGDDGSGDDRGDSPGAGGAPAAGDTAGAGDTGGDPGEDGGEPAGSASSGLPVRTRKASAPTETSGEDTSTTLFGAVRGEERAAEKDSAATRAERMTAAFFGASRKREREPEEADAATVAADGQPDDAAPEDAEEDTSAPEGGGADAADGAVPGASDDAGGRGSTDRDAADDHPEPSEAAGGTQAAVDEASSRDGDPAGTDATDATDTTDDGLERPAPAGDQAADGSATEREEAEDPEGGGAPDQPTAAFRAPAPGPDAAPGKVDQPTTAIRLPEERPGGTGSAPADTPTSDPSPDTGTAGQEKSGASRFVPLRSGDEARPPGPLPAAEPTGVGGEQERTKTQPVPDPEPLELLAQLTNTPPPPETPLRTAVRRVKIWTPLAVLLAIVFVIVQAARPLPEPELTLTADARYTFAGARPELPWPDEGQAHVEVLGIGTLGSSGEQKPVPIGSVAKTMTAYVVLRENPLKEGQEGPKITIDKKAEAGGKRGAGNGNESVLDGVEAGDTITLREAISALMIPSANNIARLLARWNAGSEAAFVDKMNAAAEELGMANTTYTDPSGLRESTVSTAVDQVKLGKKVVRMPELMSITAQSFWKNPFTGERMRNWNALVAYGRAIGIKTGTTTAAGGNLLFAGYEDVGDSRQLVVGAVLGQHKPPIIDTVNGVSRQLLDAAADTLTARTIVRKGQVVGYVDDGLGGRTPVVATEDVRAVGYPGARVGLGLEPGDGEMPHSAPAGEEVGVLTVGGGPGRIEVPVALREDLTEPGFGDKLTRIL